MAEKTWRVLGRSDLRLFDDTATNAILYAMERGGVGRFSSNNHLLVRAPDGTTISISRNRGAGRRIEEDVRKVFGNLTTGREGRRLKAAEEISTDGANALVKPASDDDPTLPCRVATCEAVFVTQGARYAHENNKHLVCPEPGCEFVTDWAPARTSHVKAVHEGIKPVGNRKIEGQEYNPGGNRPAAEITERDGVKGQVCTGACAEWKPLDDYPRKRGEKPGRRCRPCLSAEAVARNKRREEQAAAKAAKGGPVQEPGQSVLVTPQEHASVPESTPEPTPEVSPSVDVDAVSQAIAAIVAGQVAEKDRRIEILEAKLSSCEGEISELKTRLQLVRDALDA